MLMKDAYKHGVATTTKIKTTRDAVEAPSDEYEFKAADRLLKTYRHLDSPSCNHSTIKDAVLNVSIERFFATLMKTQKKAHKSITAKATGVAGPAIGVLQSLCNPDGILKTVLRELASVVANDEHDQQNKTENTQEPKTLRHCA